MNVYVALSHDGEYSEYRCFVLGVGRDLQQAQAKALEDYRERKHTDEFPAWVQDDPRRWFTEVRDHSSLQYEIQEWTV